MVDFINDFIGRKKDQPFMVYYPMILTHCPFVPTPHSDDWNPESVGSPTYKGKPEHFGDMVEYVDFLVGRIEKELERQRLLENTYIIFTGDNGTDRPIKLKLNGELFAGQKTQMTDGGTRVPLIVSRPGTVKAAEYDDLVEFSDFLPTFCEVAGKQLDMKALELDGQSFLPQLHGKEGKPREAVYCWNNPYMKAGKTKVFARDQRYKLYRNGQFYDVANDVNEKSPLDQASLSDEQKAVQARLQKVIDHYNQFDSLLGASK